jgi:hypothetical protein
MSNPYQVSGTGTAQMFDRKRLFDAICDILTKQVPEHISVTGIKLSGKTVLLRTLVDHFAKAGKHYAAALFWDLRRDTPTSDDAFRMQLVEHLKVALKGVNDEAAGYLDLKSGDEGSLGDFLELALETLKDQGQRVLLVMDGFDYLKLGTDISPNLLDQLRAFAQMSSLRLVTGSRLKLRELCKTKESRTSDFWRIFHDPPFDVLPFSDGDLDEFLKPFSDKKIAFDKPARTELLNWTGGVPILVSAIAEQLFANEKITSSVTKDDVDFAANYTLKDRSSLLDELWDDCSLELQSDLAELAQGDLADTKIPSKRIHELVRRGYVFRTGANLKLRCRLLKEHCKDRLAHAQDFSRLFGSEKLYEANIRGLLELRLSYVTLDAVDLLNDVSRAVAIINSDPRECLYGARMIMESALAVIWSHEHPSQGALPSAWKQAWAARNQPFPPELDPFPTERGLQCKLLRIVTGRDPAGPRLASKVSRRTSVVLEQLGDFGNYMNHAANEKATVGMAALMCLTAVELCVSLQRDLE